LYVAKIGKREKIEGSEKTKENCQMDVGGG
jgi:hypothetical protein